MFYPRAQVKDYEIQTLNQTTTDGSHVQMERKTHKTNWGR